jgi:alpha-L-fucosidase
MRQKLKSFVLLFGIMMAIQVGKSQDLYQSNWESLSDYKIPDWFRDAKFGIFIHWGVYSVPSFGSEWYPRNMYDTSSEEFKHHVATYGPQSKFGYKDFIPMFKAEKFDPVAWVALFKKAGAKYVVPVAEHHDGFAMYKTSMSKWNAFNMGPKRDVIGELSAEIKKQGLIFGLSSHRIEHWFFFNHGREFNSDVLDPKYADFYGPAMAENLMMSQEYMNDWLLRNIELVNNYQPQLFWFDWWIEQPALDPYRKTFAAYYYNKGKEWNKGVVINYKYAKSFPDNVAVLDLERGKLDATRTLAWQTDDAIGDSSWGYIKNNHFKSAQYVITNLIDIVSKNGNLLLNIGPRPDGTITEEETAVLLGTGKWLDINGEAIYGTRPWKVYGEGPTQSASGAFADQKVPFNSKDIRFTTKGTTLYAITLGQPKEKTTIKYLSSKAGKIASVSLLGSDTKLKWSQNENELSIQPSSSYPAEYAVTYKITFQ